MRIRVDVLLLVAAALAPGPVMAQTTTERARLVVTVNDTSGALVLDATVTLTGVDAQTKAVSVPEQTTVDRGSATFENLTVGRYRLDAVLRGFAPVKREIQLRRGDNRQTVKMELAPISESVDVSAPLIVTPGGGYTLSEGDIKQLSDNPRLMTEELKAMAGVDRIYVDGFESTTVPSKAQIKSIKITADAFSAQYHAGGARVDVITQVGSGPFTANGSYSGEVNSRGVDFNMHVRGADATTLDQRKFKGDGSMLGRSVARSPFAPEVAGFQDRWASANVSGALAQKKASFYLGADGERSYTLPLVNAALPGGTRAEVGTFKPRFDYDSVSAMFDYALNPDHALRIRYSWYRETDGEGVGGFDLTGRGNDWSYTEPTLRLLETGPIGQRGYIRSRLEFNWDRETDHSELEAPAVRVIDAFTSGGAQQAGGFRSHGFRAGSDVDYLRGNHAIHFGFETDYSRNRSTWLADYLGTWTFGSLADYVAGRALSFMRVSGDPTVSYTYVTGGAYIQDDIRLRKNFVLSAGLRYEAQTQMSDRANWAPRVGFNWAGNGGRSAFRISAGVFYGWLDAATYERAIRYDGVRLREVVVAAPTYSASAEDPAGGASNRYLLNADVRMTQNARVAVNFNQKIGKSVRIGLNYGATRGANLLRGHNLNVPVNGVRGDAEFANVIEATSDARSMQHTAGAELVVNFAGVALPGVGRGGGPGPLRQSTDRIDWRRQSIRVGYNFNHFQNNTEGPFEVPASGTLATEWGPASNRNRPDNTDLRHSWNVQINSELIRDFNVTAGFNGSVGAAYTLLTAQDDNGDLIFNDRPFGVARNSERGSPRLNVSVQVRYTLVGGTAARNKDRTLAIFARFNNLTADSNFGGYSGVLTSPFFLQATHVLEPTRRLVAGLDVNF